MGGRFCSLDQTHSECESSLVEIMSFRPQNQVKTKKKGLHLNLALNSAGICGIYSCCVALFRLFNQRSNLDEGTLNLDGGTLNFDGGTRPSASPLQFKYCLRVKKRFSGYCRLLLAGNLHRKLFCATFVNPNRHCFIFCYKFFDQCAVIKRDDSPPA